MLNYQSLRHLNQSLFSSNIEGIYMLRSKNSAILSHQDTRRYKLARSDTSIISKNMNSRRDLKVNYKTAKGSQDPP